MRLVVSGYYGFGNTGDEALLKGMLTALRQAGRVDPVVLSADPAATKALHGVEAVSRNDPRAVWRVLRQADLLISGGGGLIQDRTSARSSLYYLGVIEMAHRAGVPVYMYAQGVDPLRRPWLRRTAKSVLKRVRGAGVRDEASISHLEAIGVRPERIVLSADAAFALDPAEPGERVQALAEIGVAGHEERRIGVIWRRPFAEGAVNPEECRQSAASAVAGFARELGARVVILPFQPAVDREEAREFALAVSGAGAETSVVDDDESGQPNPRRLLALVGGLDLALCVRFHGLVFAALSGTPAVAVAYDPKVQRLAESLDVPWLTPASDMSTLHHALENAWKERASMTERMLARVKEFHTRAFNEGARALSMATERGRSTGV